MEKEIKDNLLEIADLKESNERISKSFAGNFAIKEKISPDKYRVSVKSKLGGTHQFTKSQDFSEVEILNCQAISSEIDEVCPQRKGPLLTKVFESNIRKYLEDRLDNRTYKKTKPHYSFIA